MNVLSLLPSSVCVPVTENVKPSPSGMLPVTSTSPAVSGLPSYTFSADALVNVTGHGVTVTVAEFVTNIAPSVTSYQTCNVPASFWAGISSANGPSSEVA